MSSTDNKRIVLDFLAAIAEGRRDDAMATGTPAACTAARVSGLTGSPLPAAKHTPIRSRAAAGPATIPMGGRAGEAKARSACA